MPRSFLITKLHKWKDSGGVEEVMVSDADMNVTDVRSEHLDNGDQNVPVRNLSAEHNNFTNKINADIDKSSDENVLEDVIDTASNKLRCTTADREVDEMSPLHEPMNSVTSYSANQTSSLRNITGALLCMHQSKMAETHNTCAKVFPPPMPDRIMWSNPMLFPFPLHSPPQIGFGHRSAVVQSRDMNSVPLIGKELMHTATLSLMHQPFLTRLPWQSPLCCLLQPEVAKRCVAKVGDLLPTQQLQRVTSRRVSPVNWLLSDDVRVTSSTHRDRMWNSTVDLCPASAGAARQRSANRDGGRRPATPSRPPVPASTSAATGDLVRDKKLTCRHCGKPYASLGALKMHIRTHTLPCRCQLCGKAFSRPWLLQGHLRTHTGERPFACSQCGRAFADRSNLRAHLQTHAELKKYACDRCTKTFSRLSLLVKHRNGPAICGTASSSSWRP